MSEPMRKPRRTPESYTPKQPEIANMLKTTAANLFFTYTMNLKDNEPDSFETARLIIRHFRPDDWRDLQEIAVSNEKSEFADCDHPWPTDDEGIQGACNWFTNGKQFWAVELKSQSKVICFINFNGRNKANEMDIGHVMNGTYFGNDYEYESLAVLYDYCFKYQSPDAIIAGWCMGDKEKLKPLEKLGMELISTGIGQAMRENKAGVRREIEGCRAVIRKEDWERVNPTGYTPKKPEIASMMQAAQGQCRQNPTENVLRDIPHMGYGNPSPVCYIGSVLRLMDYLNDPVAEDELFSLSGAALCFPWKEASNCDEISIVPEIPQRTFAAIGYESDYIYEQNILTDPRRYGKEFYIEKIRKSIDCGRPVVGFGFTHENYACLITGYYHDGNGLYMRAYWSPDGKPQGYHPESDQYFATENWYETCYGIVTVGEKAGARLTGGEAYRRIKESAALFVEQTTVDTQGRQYAMGFASFDKMKHWLLDDSEWENPTDRNEIYLAPCGILLLAYYRGNLFAYLDRLSKEYPGLVDPGVVNAIERLHDSVKGKEHSRLDLKESVDPTIDDFSKMRDPVVREKVAAYVERLKKMDREIFDRLIEERGE